MIVKRIRDYLSLEGCRSRLLGIWDTVLENRAAITLTSMGMLKKFVIEGTEKMTIGDVIIFLRGRSMHGFSLA